eukprot:250494-Prymnesium_polylepis.2
MPHLVDIGRVAVLLECAEERRLGLVVHAPDTTCHPAQPPRFPYSDPHEHVAIAQSARQAPAPGAGPDDELTSRTAKAVPKASNQSAKDGRVHEPVAHMPYEHAMVGTRCGRGMAARSLELPGGVNA